MLVSDIMRREVFAFRVGDSLGKICEIMERQKLYGGPVVDNDGVIKGVFTRPHLIRALMKQSHPDTLVGELMQCSITTISPDKDFSAAVKLFVDTGYQNYPVVDENGVLIGLVLASDLLEALAKECYKLYGAYNFDNSGNALIGIDEKGYIRSVSRTAIDVLGRDLEFIRGKHLVETIPLMETLGKEILSDAKKAKEFSRQLSVAQKRIEYYRSQLETIRGSKYTFNEIIGMSPQMKNMRSLAAQAAKTSSTVLIQGESGTGKELLAHAIHNASPRRNEPFIKVNCAAIPESLMEAELFGYCEGAFTGAEKGGKPGKFELANGGSIFLDEVGDLQLSTQAKLLRVLQEFEVERLGGTRTIDVDVRVIAATNHNLKELIKKSGFRQDLFYRLNVVTIETSPLRERKEDIPYLTDYLIEKVSQKLRIPVKGISDEARELLINYDFPGNVRELENILERSLNFMGDEGGTIDIEHLPGLTQLVLMEVNPSRKSAEVLTLAEIMAMAERKAIMAALQAAEGNRNEAARLLNIHRSLLYKKLNKHQIG